MSISKIVIKGILFLSIFLAAYWAEGRPIRITIVDTGLDVTATWPGYSNKICGMYDVTGMGITDNYNHGTAVVNVMTQYLQKAGVDYCITVIKFYDNIKQDYLLALKKITYTYPDIVNFSIASKGTLNGECDILKELLDNGIMIVAAAGNQEVDMSEVDIFPAMCDARIYKVQNITVAGDRWHESNYNSKPISNVVYEIGTDVVTLNAKGLLLLRTGSSFASPLFCAKQAEKMFKEKK